jgi:hypothetical protein
MKIEPILCLASKMNIVMLSVEPDNRQREVYAIEQATERASDFPVTVFVILTFSPMLMNRPRVYIHKSGNS